MNFDWKVKHFNYLLFHFPNPHPIIIFLPQSVQIQWLVAEPDSNVKPPTDVFSHSAETHKYSVNALIA